MRDTLRGIAVLSGPTADSAVNTLFVHGGVDLGWLADVATPRLAGDIDALNRRVNELVGTPVGLLRLNEAESVLWTRDLAKEEEVLVCQRLVDPILATFEVARIVLGHTPQEDMVAKTRCGGKIVLADAKMSRWMAAGPVDESSLEGAYPLAIVFNIVSGQELEAINVYYEDFAERLYSSANEELGEEVEPVSGLDLPHAAAAAVSDSLGGIDALIHAASEVESHAQLRSGRTGEPAGKRRRKLVDIF